MGERQIVSLIGGNFCIVPTETRYVSELAEPWKKRGKKQEVKQNKK